MVSSFILSNYFPFGESETCTIRNEIACEKIIIKKSHIKSIVCTISQQFEYCAELE